MPRSANKKIFKICETQKKPHIAVEANLHSDSSPAGSNVCLVVWCSGTAAVTMITESPEENFQNMLEVITIAVNGATIPGNTGCGALFGRKFDY